MDIDVFPNFATKTIHVKGRIRLKLLDVESSGPTLRLGHDLTPFFVKPTEFMRFDAISADDAKVEMNKPTDRPGIVLANLRFAKPRRPGDIVVVNFDVELVKRSFEFVVTDKVAMGADLSGWYPRPVADGEWHPEVDPTPGLTRIHMPDGWRSVASGAFLSRDRDGAGWVETWRQDTARSRSFAVGQYTEVDRKVGDIDTRVYALTPAMDPDQLSENLSKIISTLSKRFGPYPYAKYAAAEFPDDAVNWWGDALGDFQILRTSLVATSGGGFVPLAHEITHALVGVIKSPQAGPAVICRLKPWPAMVVCSRWKVSTAMKGIRKRSIPPNPERPRTTPYANQFKITADGKDVPLSKLEKNGLHYQIAMVKGTYFYHMLRREVGDEVFFATLKKLYATHVDKVLTLGEVRAAFVAATPNEDLRPFLEQWLDRTGAPVIEAKLQCHASDDGKQMTRVELTQTQPGEAVRSSHEGWHPIFSTPGDARGSAPAPAPAKRQR